MKLSKKKESELYEIIHKEIMDARIKIYKMKDSKFISINEIDNIMSDLLTNAPQKAIELFKK